MENIANYFDGDSTELDFNLSDFDMVDIDMSPERYIKPKFNKNIITVDYQNAAKLAKEVKLFAGEQIHCIVNGSFIFGDFIEALLVEKNVQCQEMYISTLGLSQENIDSLHGLLTQDYIIELNLMISNYFYSHEKHKMIPYLLGELDIDDRFQLIVCRNHTKIALMKISDFRLVLTGSSNLRSSKNIEQFVLQESKELYDYYYHFFQEHKNYSIIDKGVKDGKCKKRI